MVDSILVHEEVKIGGNDSNDWTILLQLSLESLFSNGDTIGRDFILGWATGVGLAVLSGTVVGFVGDA